MAEERQAPDPTRKLLRVFGVKVTDYEERMAAILGQAGATTSADELADLAKEALTLTADLNERLRDMTNHVLATQSRLLGELRAALERTAGTSASGR